MANMTLSHTKWVDVDYEKLMIFLNGKTSKKIARNTTIEGQQYAVQGKAVTLRYHFTDVITWYADGKINLSSGGYETPTTKERINFGLQDIAYVYQKGYRWYLVYQGKTYDFSSGMVINTVAKTVQEG